MLIGYDKFSVLCYFPYYMVPNGIGESAIKRYWLRGGLIVVLIAVIVLPLIGYLGVRKLGLGDEVILYLAPGLFAAGMASMGHEPSSFQFLQAVIIGIGLTILQYFLLGTLLGFIYGKIISLWAPDIASSNFNLKKFLIGLLLVVILIFFISSIFGFNLSSFYNHRQSFIIN